MIICSSYMFIHVYYLFKFLFYTKKNAPIRWYGISHSIDEAKRERRRANIKRKFARIDLYEFVGKESEHQVSLDFRLTRKCCGLRALGSFFIGAIGILDFILLSL